MHLNHGKKANLRLGWVSQHLVLVDFCIIKRSTIPTGCTMQQLAPINIKNNPPSMNIQKAISRSVWSYIKRFFFTFIFGAFKIALDGST